MAYFAVQVVSGREMVTKNAIEIAARNHKRIDIKEIVVPSQIVLDLNSSSKRSKANTLIAFTSYVFLNIETITNDSYQEMNAELFQFLKRIPNIRNILKQSIDRYEMAEMLRKWDNLDLTELVVFKIEKDQEAMSDHANPSILTKTKEILANKKVISEFKYFVQHIAIKDKKRLSALSYSDNENGLIIFSPLSIIMEGLKRSTMTIKEFMKAPHKFLSILTDVCYANYNPS